MVSEVPYSSLMIELEVNYSYRLDHITKMVGRSSVDILSLLSPSCKHVMLRVSQSPRVVANHRSFKGLSGLTVKMVERFHYERKDNVITSSLTTYHSGVKVCISHS